MSNHYGLIFDVDGVIANTEPVNARVTIKVLEDMFGLKNVKPDDFTAGLGRGAEQYILAAAKVHNLKLTDEQLKAAAQLREQYLIKAMKKEPLPAFPGVTEIIDAALQRKDFRLAIATSASYELSRSILESAKIPYKKMAYVSGDDVKQKKPNPELFLLASKRMNLEPNRCVVIEDAPNGVAAAKAAGAKCIAVTNTTFAEKLQQADLICNSLEQIDLDVICELITSGPL